MVVFAVQDVIKDPPFTRLDLLTCRNLLIYFEPELQDRLLPVFHYALNPGGVLFLSPSESIGKFTDLFSPLDRKWKFYTSRYSLSPRSAGAYTYSPVTTPAGKGLPDPAVKPHETNFVELTRGILLESYAPPSVITDEEGNTLYVHGDTGKYLRPAPGAASLNIIEMAREGLQLELQEGSPERRKTEEPVSRSKTCRSGPMAGCTRSISLSGPSPIRAAQRTCSSSVSRTPPRRNRERAPGTRNRTRRDRQNGWQELEQELLYTRENLQATIIGTQASNEELKSTNEELQSTNEELQSTNEELETSKEELQSVNEEIVTVNAELQAKIEQLTDIQNDMKNLLDSTSIGTIFLDENLAIKRFTREAARVFRLVPPDAGRPLADIKSSIVTGDIVADAQEVLDTMVPREKEVMTAENLWYLARLTPYRTLENVIEGVVITFTDITSLKSLEREAKHTRELAENVIDTIREPLHRARR